MTDKEKEAVNAILGAINGWQDGKSEFVRQQLYHVAGIYLDSNARIDDYSRKAFIDAMLRELKELYDSMRSPGVQWGAMQPEIDSETPKKS